MPYSQLMKTQQVFQMIICIWVTKRLNCPESTILIKWLDQVYYMHIFNLITTLKDFPCLVYILVLNVDLAILVYATQPVTIVMCQSMQHKQWKCEDEEKSIQRGNCSIPPSMKLGNDKTNQSDCDWRRKLLENSKSKNEELENFCQEGTQDFMQIHLISRKNYHGWTNPFSLNSLATPVLL